jgi:hypothetical protein
LKRPLSKFPEMPFAVANRGSLFRNIPRLYLPFASVPNLTFNAASLRLSGNTLYIGHGLAIFFFTDYGLANGARME